MRKTITLTAIAIIFASGLSFAAADKEGQNSSESGMMGGGMHIEMMDDMHGMMKECREMMTATKASHSQDDESPAEA